MCLLYIPSLRYRFLSRPFFASVFSQLHSPNLSAQIQHSSPSGGHLQFLAAATLFFNPILHTLNESLSRRRVNIYEKMRQAWKDWAEAARDTWTHWELSQGGTGKGLAEPGKHSRSLRRLPSVLRPSQAKARSSVSENHRPQRPALAWPGIYLFLGSVASPLLTEKGKRIPKCLVWWQQSTGQEGCGAQGCLEGAGPQHCHPVPELRVQVRRCHTWQPWWAALMQTTGVQVTSGTLIPWDSPHAPSTTGSLPYLLFPSSPTRGPVAASSDCDSEERQGAAEDLL